MGSLEGTEDGCMVGVGLGTSVGLKEGRALGFRMLNVKTRKVVSCIFSTEIKLHIVFLQQ